MANLNVENLNKIVQTGDVETLMGGSGPVSEARVAKEMQSQGMQPGNASGDFQEMLKHSLEEVNQDQVNANTAIHELVAGRSKNIHETMLAVERADTSLKLMMQVRNKALDAYREIMRMQV